jgi:two-component system response regulator HydG
MIGAESLPEAIQAAAGTAGAIPIGLDPGRSLKDMEREMIFRTLNETGGNRTHAAKILGISRRTLQLKLKDYGINEI